MSPEWSTTTTAFAITRRDREWLMIRQARLGLTSWELPGGHVDPGETMEQAAARESFEETGVPVAVGGLLAVCVHEWHERRERKLICFFDAQPSGRVFPRLSPDEPDIHEVAWLDPIALLPQDVSPFLHPLIEQQRLGWSDVPFSFSMVHQRNTAGLWAPAPAPSPRYQVPEPFSPACGPR
jgi:8-oxo-dGTP pyrophosphatase MutT (NUDIX family)